MMEAYPRILSRIQLYRRKQNFRYGDRIHQARYVGKHLPM